MRTNFYVFLLIAILFETVFCYEPLVKQLTLEEIESLNSMHSDSLVRTATLDSEGKFKLSWAFNSKFIIFNIDVQTEGWAGMGFSSKAGMIMADLVIVWVDKDGVGHISDRYAKRNGFPPKDISQDYYLVNSSREDGHLKATILRKLKTCDSYDNILTQDTTRVLYAFSDHLPEHNEDFDQHSLANRGVQSLFLFDSATTKAHLPNDTVALDFVAEDVIWPNKVDTLYWCQMFQLPKWPVHHLLRLEAIIQPGNEPYLHHIAIYQCSKNMSQYLNRPEACFVGNGENTSPMYECSSRLLYFWTPGMAPMNLPENVGMPMFEGDEEPFLLLEMHYDNGRLAQDVVDHSGLRLYFSPTPRPVEAGVMLLGTPENAAKQIIPPGEKAFRFYSHFDACLSKTLPPEGTQLAYGLLHQHLYGKEIRVHHIRDGVELTPILEDNEYDFYYQQYRPVDPLRTILPGDNIVLECMYNTMKKNETVFGGYSTRDEMCGATFLYYPRVASGFICASYPDPSVYVPMFGSQLIDKDTVQLGDNGSYVPLVEFVQQHLNWSIPGVREKYQDFVKNGRHLLDFYYTPLSSLRQQPDGSNETTIPDDMCPEFPELPTNQSATPGSEPGSKVRYELLEMTGFPKITAPYKPAASVDICNGSSRNRIELGISVLLMIITCILLKFSAY